MLTGICNVHKTRIEFRKDIVSMFFFNILYKIDVIVFFEKPTDGSEMWVLGCAHQLKQKGLGGGESHIGGALQPLQRHLTVISPKGNQSQL